MASEIRAKLQLTRWRSSTSCRKRRRFFLERSVELTYVRFNHLRFEKNRWMHFREEEQSGRGNRRENIGKRVIDAFRLDLGVEEKLETALQAGRTMSTTRAG